ncbi:ERF family protein [Devosia chinhatensis]|uniref:ERF family protein n=1 Tax=Devosia chinhatensis TaxID=429727 RepID=UPI000696E40B|nr:ERF family protein [Devosia chinhatensis]
MSALAERLEVPKDVAEAMQPASQLTPIQMAYQLLSNGHDLGAVKEMIAFGKELEADAAEKAFNEAMAAAQKEMGVVATNMANTQTKSRYADYAQLDKALRPIYTKHGFALSFNDGVGAPADWVRIVCHVTNSGHTRTYHKDMPADGKGARGNDVMTKTHAVGAAQSYAMRYLLRMIFNVAVGEGDTDGNMPAELITEQQVLDLNDLIDTVVERLGAKRPGYVTTFLKFMKVDCIEDIAARDYQKAVTAINSTGAAR